MVKRARITWGIICAVLFLALLGLDARPSWSAGGRARQGGQGVCVLGILYWSPDGDLTFVEHEGGYAGQARFYETETVEAHPFWRHAPIWRTTRIEFNFNILEMENTNRRYLTTTEMDALMPEFIEIWEKKDPGSKSLKALQTGRPVRVKFWPGIIYQVGALIEYLIYALLALAGLKIYLLERGFARLSDNHCVACGYDLRGIEAERCPECGSAVDETRA